MRVLVVHCHPRQDSFCASLREAVLDGLARAGHEANLLDLYVSGFSPALMADEQARDHTEGENLRGIEDHVARLRAAEASVLVYPT